MALRLPARPLVSAAFQTRRRPYSQAAAAVAPAINTAAVQDSKSHVEPADLARYMLATYSRPSTVFVRGKGSYLWDMEGRPYLDFTAGIAVNGLGHCDDGVTQVITDQAKTLVHASNLYHNLETGALSRLLVEKTIESGGMHDAATVFVCNSGTEANEAALKFARKVGNPSPDTHSKIELVSFRGAFHGRTMGSLSATPNEKYQRPFAPLVSGFRYGELNDIESLRDLVNDDTAGVIVEPIQGEGGVNPATDEFLVALAKRCREKKAVLIYDEIQCGLSRTGTLWAHSHLPREAHPDIITTAKALGNGFPVGATIVNKTVSEKMSVGDHGTTFGGNPLACRVAHHIVTRLADPELQKAVLVKSEIFQQRFAKLRGRFPELVGQTSGRGLILGLRLAQDPAPIVNAARERGLLIITCGTNTLRFVPPLTISEGEIESGLDILEDAIAASVASS